MPEEGNMRIAVCDDEILSLKQTSGIIRDVFSEMQLKCIIDEFANADGLLKSKKKYAVVFLDIELKDSQKNGIWAAKHIKASDPDCAIIFTTNYEEYIDEVIGKYAFRYWSKPINANRLQKSIQLLLNHMKTITIEICSNKQKLEIMLKDIIYITPQGKHCKIITVSNEYVVIKSFKEINELLTSKNVCKCHGSYCVNLDYVEKYTKTEVYLKYKTNKYKVHLSRRQYMAFKEQMFIIGGEKE